MIKGRSLYNLGPAREAAGKASTLIVAEGYMDVIALAQAGFAHAVAPLGTAITENQLLLLWRLSPEPVIALDGDTAGLRAAMRLIDIALPLLEPGRSLRFCLLPEGLDPDDLIKAQGPQAMQKLLDGARPMVDLLWQREVDGKVYDSPERRAALDAALRSAISKIRDMSIRNHYTAAIKELRAELFAPKGRKSADGKRGNQNWQRRSPIPLSTPGAKASLLAQTDTGERLREGVILALCASYPAIIASFDTTLEKLRFSGSDFSRLRDALLRHAPDCEQDPEKLSRNIGAEIGPDALENLLGLSHVRISPAIRKPVDTQTAAMALAEELAKLEANRGSAAEISDALQDMTGLVDEGLTWRLGQAAEARAKASRSALPAGGAESEDRENMSKYLQNLIDSQVWVKKKQ